jgi:transglutaminase-like putative cysteine protease
VPIAGEEGIGRRTWLTVENRLRATYRATVDLDRPAVDPARLAASPHPELPPLVVPYLFPSRYCESDRFETFVGANFGELEGGAKIAAMADWIGREMAYSPGSTDATTTAADAFVARQGVCRDYAHLMATFARAAGIPARLVSGYALDLDPPDFHAVVEVWLEGAWHLVDATCLAPTANVARICVGRDATDIAFMTIFGAAELVEQKVTVRRG